MDYSKEGLYGERINNDTRRFSTDLHCVECGKHFTPKDNQLIFKRSKEFGMVFICDSCDTKHQKKWELKSVQIVPDADGMGRGKGICTMSNGTTYDHHYGWNDGQNTDIPQAFYDKFRKLHQEYHEKKQAVLIKDLIIEDNFDRQCLHVEQNNGTKYDLDYRVGLSGLILDQRQLTNVTPELMALIKERLRGQNLSIGGAK